MSKAQRIIASLLSLNALLLTALLWVQIAGGPVLAGTAYAEQSQRLPNAGLQRDRMIALLGAIQKTSAETKAILEKGHVKVVVTSEPAKKTGGPGQRTGGF